MFTSPEEMQRRENSKSKGVSKKPAAAQDGALAAHPDQKATSKKKARSFMPTSAIRSMAKKDKKGGKKGGSGSAGSKGGNHPPPAEVKQSQENIMKFFPGLN